jgi:hypothetical protein
MSQVTKDIKLGEVIKSYLSMLKECGVTYDDLQLILEYCQSLNKIVRNDGLKIMIDNLVHQLTYYSELDVIFYIENNDILNRIEYYCSLV